jgi:biopolymer transport protein ExbB
LDHGFLGIIEQASASLWIIVGCSVIALAVAVERGIALWGFTAGARRLADAVARSLYRGDVEDARTQCDRSGSPASDLFLAALIPIRGAKAQPIERIAAAVERERQQVGLKLRRNLWILGTVGAIAPFIGLFGTVLGIMHAFRQIEQTGQGGFRVVAAGISEALIATAGGLAVGIEAVILYNFLNVHVQKLVVNLRLLAEEYLEIVRETLPALRGPEEQLLARPVKEA